MDFLDEEEIKEIYEEEFKTVEEQLKNDKETAKVGLDKETYGDKHKLYMSLPAPVVIYLARTIFIPNYDCSGLTLARQSDDIRKLGAVEDLKKVVWPKDIELLNIDWVLRRLEAGWNTGKGASTFSQLNVLAAFYGQLEFIPLKPKEGKDTLFYCHKVRYNSVPYIPFSGNYCVADLAFYFDGTELRVRPVPSNLQAALVATKTIWKPAALAKKFLVKAQAYFPAMKNTCSLALILGDNLKTLKTTYNELDPKFVMSIEPLRENQSIFAGSVQTNWILFFEGFALDRLGKVSAARALASYGDFGGYYGQLTDIAVWLNEPKVLKVQTRLDTILKHRYIDFRSYNEWPQNCCVYNPTPGELNAFISLTKEYPAALAMPLTAVMSSAPQVDTYCKRFDCVDMIVLFSDPPTVVFQNCKTGLSGRTMKDNLILLEKAVVRGYLNAAKLIGRDDLMGFRIVPDATYSAELCHVKTVVITSAFNCGNKRYVSMTDEELRRYVPTARVGDVQVDGNKAADGGVKGSIPQYPRKLPDIHYFEDRLYIGELYYGNGETTGDEVTVDLTSWTIPKAITKRKTSEDIPTVHYEVKEDEGPKEPVKMSKEDEDKYAAYSVALGARQEVAKEAGHDYVLTPRDLEVSAAWEAKKPFPEEKMDDVE